MEFKIKSLILWPKDETKEIRRIDFRTDKVNVITGGSEKGKSALIAIIDYCLASGSCKIPRKAIRDTTSWFGILVGLEEDKELLLVRKEPGLDKISGEMYMKFDNRVNIPSSVVSNCNYSDVKHRLNGLAKLSYVDFEQGENAAGFNSRPGFRDMVSFTFQPQYIVANQSSLFYKSDSAQHREKLRVIFPYILKAVDNEYLELKEELKERERELYALDKELEKRRKISQKWLGEIRAIFVTAKEYGLLESAPYPNDDWKPEEFINYLRTIPVSMNTNEVPVLPVGATSATTQRISDLQNQEIEIAFGIQNLKTRQELIRKIEATNRGYRDSLLDQRSRLDTLGWFNKTIKDRTSCPFCETETPKARVYVRKLIEVNNGILEKGLKNNDHHTVLNGELDKIGKELSSSEAKMNIIRDELRSLLNEDKKADRRLQTLSSIYKFVGQLESELRNFDEQLDFSDLNIKILECRDRINFIHGKIKQESVENKLRRAKGKISEAIKHYAKIFNAANHNEYIELNIRDLTLNFTSENGRVEALYEIGSGSNYMAYHLSTLLALHEFFLDQKEHPVPNTIVFDQPSQAYFPDIDLELTEKNEDITRVKRIFEALSSAITRTHGKLQIIVLEHVGRYAWESDHNVVMIKRWRETENDDALIPRDWLLND